MTAPTLWCTARNIAESLERRQVIVVGPVATGDHGLLVREVTAHAVENIYVVNVSQLPSESVVADAVQGIGASSPGIPVAVIGVMPHHDDVVVQIIGITNAVMGRRVIVVTACDSALLPSTMAKADDLLALTMAPSLAETVDRIAEAMRRPDAQVIVVGGVHTDDHSLVERELAKRFPDAFAVAGNTLRFDSAMQLAELLMAQSKRVSHLVVSEAHRIPEHGRRDFTRIAHIATGLPVVLLCPDEEQFANGQQAIVHGVQP